MSNSPATKPTAGSPKQTLRVFGSLVVLLILEYSLARLSLPTLPRVVGMSLLATTYSVLMAWYFMHVRSEGRWIYLTIVPVVVLALIVVGGLVPDVMYHETGFYQAAATSDH